MTFIEKSLRRMADADPDKFEAEKYTVTRINLCRAWVAARDFKWLKQHKQGSPVEGLTGRGLVPCTERVVSLFQERSNALGVRL